MIVDYKNNFVIAGGGTAGWITAAVLSNMFTTKNITLIENSKIGTIGVGESTTPAILDFLNMCSIDLVDFMIKTETTIKTGIKFENWTSSNSSYFHTFDLIRKQHLLDDMPGYDSVLGYDYLHDFLKDTHPYNYMEEKNLLPINSKGNMLGTHALHINAHKFVAYLKDLLKDKVTVIDDTILECDISESGIQKIKLQSGKELTASIYFDCTGFKRVLHSKLGSNWKSCKEILPVDRAIPCPLNWNSPMSATHASALDHGWVWQVPLQTRLGTGYVYSSEFAKTPEEDFFNFIEKKYNKKIDVDRIIKFDSGYLKNPWNKNVVCVGLSSGFVEPLESTSIHMIYHQVVAFVHSYDGVCSTHISNVYNNIMEDMYEDTVAFIKLHYLGNQGKNEFWDYMNQPNCERLNELLDLWKYHLPSAGHIGQHKNETPGYRLIAIGAWLQVMQGMKKIPKNNLERFILFNDVPEINSYVDDLTSQKEFVNFITNLKEKRGI